MIMSSPTVKFYPKHSMHFCFIWINSRDRAGCGAGGGGGGGGAPPPPPPPPSVFLIFFLEDKTSALEVFCSCLFILRAHFEKSLVIVRYYCYEISSK